jgi:hypothetical protein
VGAHYAWELLDKIVVWSIGLVPRNGELWN